MTDDYSAVQEHKDPDEITKRMAEFLTLAEAVRGLKGKAPGVVISHVGGPLPTSSPAPAPEAAVDENTDRRDYWSGNPDNSLLEVSPLLLKTDSERFGSRHPLSVNQVL